MMDTYMFLSLNAIDSNSSTADSPAEVLVNLEKTGQ